MATENEADFVRTLGVGFLAHRLKRTSEFLVEQSTTALHDLGLHVPARSASTVLLLFREGPKSITEIAFRLQFSHPFIIKICERLMGADLATSDRDHSDARRRIISLTEKGMRTAASLERFTDALAQTFRDIFEQCGVDLLSALDAFDKAASTPSIRVRAKQSFLALAKGGSE
jgi:DNA-binding MarR family transcriptional regulator